VVSWKDSRNFCKWLADSDRVLSFDKSNLQGEIETESLTRMKYELKPDSNIFGLHNVIL